VTVPFLPLLFEAMLLSYFSTSRIFHACQMKDKYDKHVTVRLTFGKRLYSLSLYGVKLKNVEKKSLEDTQWIFI
jgi:hypothetical protein